MVSFFYSDVVVHVDYYLVVKANLLWALSKYPEKRFS